MADKKSRRDPANRQKKVLERRIQTALTTIFDPATPHIDLFNMGMIYAVHVDDQHQVVIELAYSSPGHPGNIGLPQQVEGTVTELEGVTSCKVEIVTDPPWTLDRVSDHARINMSVVGESK